jgi:enoyl-[acyl-carrier-protein] reductase (NADH)
MNREVCVCHLENLDGITNFTQQIQQKHIQINVIVRSTAFGNYAEGFKSFHEMKR